MNEMNPPFYLPSGYLISKRAKERLIEDFAGERTNEIDPKLKCPITSQVYRESELRKVYFS